MADRVLGTDVSHWQGSINWGRMAGAAIKFAFIKATQADNITDARFAANWRSAAQVGILRGAYHFYMPNTPPASQAQFFFNALQSTGALGELPPVLDVEHHPNSDRKPLLQGPILDTLNEIERLFGRRPIIYTARGVWNQIGEVPWAEQYPLWIAQYPYTAWSNGVISYTMNNQPVLPKSWKKWLFWQFSEKAPGVNYGVGSKFMDINVFQGSEAALRELAAAPPAAGSQPGSGSQPVQPARDIVERWVEALNTRMVTTAGALYSPSAVHVTALGTVQGRPAIQTRLQILLSQVSPRTGLQLTGFTGVGNSRSFTWTAQNNQGQTISGNDTLGLQDNQIVYHFSSYMYQ